MRQGSRARDVEVLALIPARGGSKGIPRKNLLEISGKPVIAYSIEQALKSQCIDRVVVSTDDSEIARVAQSYGAEVPFLRPPEFARDLSPDIEAFQHALSTLNEVGGYQCDYVVHLRPPTILRSVLDIDEAIEIITSDPQADTLRSVCAATYTPFKMWKVEGPYLSPLLQHDSISEPQSMPRQLLPQFYWQNGYVDIIRADVIARGRMVGDCVIPYIIEKQVPELDYPEDIQLLESWIERYGIHAPPRSFDMTNRHAA